MSDPLERAAALWSLGLQQVWERYTAAQEAILAPLRDHTKGRVRHTVGQLCGSGEAMEAQALEWLAAAVLAEGAHKSLDQLVPAGLHSRDLELCLEGMLRIHRTSLSFFPEACRIVQ